MTILFIITLSLLVLGQYFTLIAMVLHEDIELEKDEFLLYLVPIVPIVLIILIGIYCMIFYKKTRNNLITKIKQLK